MRLDNLEEGEVIKIMEGLAFINDKGLVAKIFSQYDNQMTVINSKSKEKEHDMALEDWRVMDLS
jgi:hypothetical protein